MTLLVTLLTQDWIIQASDRRVTYADGKVGDEWNKSVMIDDGGCVTYTGLAELDGSRPTDQLVMDVVQQAFRDPSRSLVNRMMLAADAAVAKNRGLPDRAHTSRTSIVLAAFAKVPPQLVPSGKVVAERAPTLSVVTNAQISLSQHWSPKAGKRFHALVYPLGVDEDYFLHIAGQRIGAAAEKRLRRDIRQALARTNHPETLGRLLARTIQMIAQGNPMVGGSVFCTFVHRAWKESPPAEHGWAQVMATNLPRGCRSQNEYERKLFRAGSGMKHGILFGPHDPQGVIPTPSYVNADVAIDGVLMIHESLDVVAVQQRWDNRHVGRKVKTNWPAHWWRRQGPLP